MRERALEITPMTPDDIDQVVAIEIVAQPSPWPRQIFLEELDREWGRLEVIRQRDAGGNSRVVAYINYWLVRDEVHLLNLAVDPTCRRQGLGRALMNHLIDVAQANGCRYITLEVRASNEPALGLYGDLGFEQVGLRPRYYADNQEDAIVMLREIVAPDAPG